MAATLPTSIVVGPLTYTVRFDEAAMNRAVRDEGTDLYGIVSHDKLVIDIDPGVAPDIQARTLLHEALHTLTEITGITDDVSKRREESIVTRLAPALLALLRDNPTLVAYLVG